MKKHLLIMALLASVTTVTTAHACYSEGVRVGTIQKFSKKGYIMKSWEGELVVQGTQIRGSNGNVRGGDVWKFSVLDPTVASAIDNATMTGGSIALKYCQEVLSVSTDTTYIITKAVAR